MQACSPPVISSGNSDSLSYNARTEGGLRKRGYFRQTARGWPLISVVTVVLNGEKYLEQTIQSVINQPYENLEYLVIDGGSRDGTLDILNKYGDELDYWQSEPDQGIYHAMNKGWNLCRGEFVYYLGADDMLIEVPVQALVKAQVSGYDIVHGDVLLSNGRRFVSRYGPTLRFNNTLHHQGLFLRRSLFNLSPFAEDLKVFSDFDLNQRLRKSKRVALKADLLVAFFRLSRERNVRHCKEFFQTIRRNYGVWTMVCAYVYLRMRGLAFRLQGRKI
jgi:glycosyltransferase involved in cell wall biosynthesis